MIDKVEYIEVNDIKYPIFCSLNVLEEIQDRYGSIGSWDKKITGKGEDENEISASDLKTTLALMLNEGADILEKEILTEKQVGRILGQYGLHKALELVQEQVKTCIYGKNASTTQNNMETEDKVK